MTSAVDRLLEIAGPSFGPNVRVSAETGGSQLAPLLKMLSRRNGFQAFLGALVVLPMTETSWPSSPSWNAGSWRASFGDRLSDTATFFAVGLFGDQWAIDEGRVTYLDPELGELVDFAASIEEWAERILGEHRVLTGWPLLERWDEQGASALEPGHRLFPEVPFVAGGDFAVANLQAAPLEVGLRRAARLSELIAQVSDGDSVDLDLSW